MPPTRAAARKTAWGRRRANRDSASVCRRRSASLLAAVRIVQFSRAKRRSSADPTMPLWPATNTRFPASEYAARESFMAEALGVIDSLQVRLDHFADKFVKSYGGLPAKPLVCLARIAEQGIDLGRAEIAGIDLDQDLAALGIDARLLEALAPPGDRPADMRKGALNE